MSQLSNFFFNSLPHYFHENDSYKDENGKGLLERYMEVTEEEAETVYQEIKDLPKAYQAKNVKESHLYLLGSVFGNPPTLFLNKANYRKLIEYLPNLLKRKGTLQALVDIFKIMSVEAEVEDVTPPKPFYDLGLEHDNGHKYDEGCSDCFFFKVHLTDPLNNIPNTGGELSQETVTELTHIIYYVTPINGFLVNITHNGESLAYLLEKTGLPLAKEDGKYLKIKGQ